MDDPQEPPLLPQDLATLRRVGTLMDAAVRIPGTNVKLGLDALLGLVPGAGDAVATVVAWWTVAAGVQHRVPLPVLLRMVVNTLVDAGVGSVPVLGDILDILFQSNVKNVELLLRHRDASQPPRPLPVLVKGVLVVAAAGTMTLAVLVGVLCWALVAAVLR